MLGIRDWNNKAGKHELGQEGLMDASGDSLQQAMRRSGDRDVSFFLCLPSFLASQPCMEVPWLTWGKDVGGVGWNGD